MTSPLLKSDCLETGFDDLLRDLLARFYGIAAADVADLHLFSHDPSRADRHFTIGDEGLCNLAGELSVFGSGDGAPLIVTRMLETDRERLPELPRLRAEGVCAVLVFPLQLGKDHQLGRIVVLSRDPLDETLTETGVAFLESVVVQLTLAIEAHDRREEASFLALRWANHGHRFRNHLGLLAVRLSDLAREYPGDGRFPRHLKELEALGTLTRMFEQPGHYFSDFPLSFLAEAVIAETLQVFGARERVGLSIDGDPVKGLGLRDLEAMAMVIGELATDSCKYAWPPDEVGAIYVRLEEKKEGGKTWVTLQYADNGCDLPHDFDLATASGTGLRLVEKVMQSIGGTLVLCEKPLSFQLVHGFSATLRFPK